MESEAVLVQFIISHEFTWPCALSTPNLQGTGSDWLDGRSGVLGPDSACHVCVIWGYV